MTPLFDIIIFAIIAVFLFLRLKGTLGEYNDDETPFKKQDKNPKPSQKNIEIIVKDINPTDKKRPQKDNKKTTSKNSWPGLLPDFSIVTSATTYNKLLDIHKTQPDFDPHHFLVGAMRAYDMILEAIHNKDRATIEMLLTPEMISKTEQQLNLSDTNETKTYTPTAQEALIYDAKLTNEGLSLTVNFWAADLSTPKISGEYDKRKMFQDRWVFTKKHTQNNDIWLLADIIDIEDA